MDVQSTKLSTTRASQLTPQNVLNTGQATGMIDLFAAALANSEQRLDAIDPNARGKRQDRERQQPESLERPDDTGNSKPMAREQDHHTASPDDQLKDSRSTSPSSHDSTVTREAEGVAQNEPDDKFSSKTEEISGSDQSEKVTSDEIATGPAVAARVPSKHGLGNALGSAELSLEKSSTGLTARTNTGAPLASQPLPHAPKASSANPDAAQAKIIKERVHQTNPSQGQLFVDTNRKPIQMTLPRVVMPNSTSPGNLNPGQGAPAMFSTEDLTAATARLTAQNTASTRGNTNDHTGQGKQNLSTTALNDGQTYRLEGQAEIRATARMPATAAALAQNHGSSATTSSTQTLAQQPSSSQNDFLLQASTRSVIEDLTAATARLRGTGSLSQAANLSSTSTQSTAAPVSANAALANTTNNQVAPNTKLTPSQGREVVKQVMVQLIKGAQAGDSTIRIQLRPTELGRVDVKLEISNGTLLKATVVVEKPETLELLQRDARTLERALNDAGLKTNSGGLSFALNDHGKSDQNQEEQSGPRDKATKATEIDETLAESATGQSNTAGDGLIDMMA